MMKLNAFPVAMSPGIAARSLWELQGEETCLHLETSAKGEVDLQTHQAAVAGAQKSYSKVKILIFKQTEVADKIFRIRISFLSK